MRWMPPPPSGSESQATSDRWLSPHFLWLQHHRSRRKPADRSARRVVVRSLSREADRDTRLLEECGTQLFRRSHTACLESRSKWLKVRKQVEGAVGVVHSDTRLAKSLCAPRAQGMEYTARRVEVGVDLGSASNAATDACWIGAQTLV